MKLGLKLTLALTMGVSVVLAAYAYVRVERELLLFEADMAADHMAFGRALANAAGDVAGREGRSRALELIDDANVREGDLDIGWTAEARQEATSEVVEDATGARWRITFVPLDLGGVDGGIRLREPMDDEDRYVRDTIVRSIAITGITVLVCGLIILIFSLVFVGRPMAMLVEKARRVGNGDLTGPLHVRQRDEVGALAEEMNAMCERLAEAQERAVSEAAARIATLEQLRHAERLATVGELASGLAHEMGTPLNVVQARARLIQRGESTGAGAQNDARIVVEQTVRMTAIIRQLLAFARHRPPRKERRDLLALARQASELLEPLATKQGIRMEAPPGPDGYEVALDGGQMEQVLTNLIMNAIQAQPEGGVVRIRSGRGRRASPEEPGREADWVWLAVGDEGTGMTPETVARVFEPFFTTKEVGEGTGLGLSVAWGIVREHGGFIDVRSEPGRGSTLTVWLPVESAK